LTQDGLRVESGASSANAFVSSMMDQRGIFSASRHIRHMFVGTAPKCGELCRNIFDEPSEQVPEDSHIEAANTILTGPIGRLSDDEQGIFPVLLHFRTGNAVRNRH